jgi:hypothetical protein
MKVQLLLRKAGLLAGCLTNRASSNYFKQKRNIFFGKYIAIQFAAITCSGIVYAQADLAQCRIKNLYSGKYLSIQNAATANGARLVQGADNGSNAFKWILTYNSGGYYVLTNVNSGKVAALPGGNQVASTVPEQEQSTGSISQQWKIKPMGANAHIIQSNMSNGYVLTNPVGSAEGGLMNINAYNGSTNQQWAIESTVANANSYAANSTNLVFSTPSNAILKMLKTKIVFSAYNSYFETLTFTNGYAGLQLTNDASWGSNYISISSLWDPAGGGVSNAEYVAPGVTAVHGDNGEGSATTTIAPYNWQYNVYYNIVVRAWERDGKLHLGTFINNLSNNTWFHQTTITTTNDGTFLGSGEASFIENWAAGDATISANNVRKAYYKDCWNMTTSGAWEKPTGGYVNSNRSAASLSRAGIWDASFDGGYDAAEGAYYMQTGGLTRRNPGFGNNDYINLPLQPDQGAAPVLTVGAVSNVTLNYTNGQVQINWVNDNTKSPQLFSNAELVDQNGVVISSSQETLPQKRSVSYPVTLIPGNTYTARVTIIDIFNQQSAVKTSAPFTVSAGTVKGCVGGSLQVNATTANAAAYQWQYQNANGSWSNYPEGMVPGYATFTGTQTATMTVSNISNYYIDHPNTVRAIITLANGAVTYSATQQWQAQGITQQPANASACAGGTLQVSAAASGNSYQWQYQNANGSWSNYPEGPVAGYATFTNTQTPVMTISNISSYYITHPNQARLVVYGANGCTVNSNTITWGANSCSQTMSGTAKFESQQGQVQVYPNPVQDELTINSAGLSNYLVEIRNTLGQLVYKTSTAEQTIKVSFKDKAQGVYFVKVTNTQNREAKTFTIVK